MALEPIELEIAQILARNGIFITTQNDGGTTSRADRDNTRPGKLEGYDCPVCLNRGYSFYMDGDYERTRECECMTIRRNLKRVEDSGLSDALKRYSFETWQTPDEWQTKFIRIAKEYALRPSGWLLASGQSGSGKTHLCTAVCGQLMESGIDTLYIRWRDFSTRAKGMVNDPEGYARLTDSAKNIRCLYIDDLFKTAGRPTTADINLAYEILNVRYDDSDKLTVISTELSAEEMANIDEALTSRIYERSRGHILNFAGKENWRWT